MNRNDHHLIQQVLDGDITREAFDAFQQRLREEPKLLALYGDYALLHHTLCEEFEGRSAAGLHLLGRERRVYGIRHALAVAAVLALLAVVWFTRPQMGRGAPDDVALLTFSVDAVWEIEGSTRSIGGATGVGGGSVLHLACGRAGVSLSPTVTALIEGPAELTFLSGKAVFIKTGRGYFTVGGSGDGLVLETPRIKTSDFGAVFGIEVPAQGAEEILVSFGEMRIVSKASKEEVVLAEGDAAQIPPKGSIGRFPVDDRRFAKALGRFRSVSPISVDAEVDGHNRLLRLPQADSSVLLTTLDLGRPSEDVSSGDSWPFMSFFSKGSEVLQLGDATTPDVPQTVTLRYDPFTGDVSLHEGGLPLGPVICSGKIPPGSEFDEIRMGALSGEALSAKALDIRVGLE